MTVSSFDPGHRHHPKTTRALAPVIVHGATLKWSNIHSPGADVPHEVHALAVAAVAANPSGLNPGETGFVILHRCGDSFYFLLVQTWRNGNELWETVLYKDATLDSFVPFPATGLHRPTFCVWEMAVVWHETEAWRRYLLSPRDPAALAAWQADTLSGPV